MFHTIHFSKAKPAKYFPDASEAYNRCASTAAHLAHLLVRKNFFFFFKVVSEVLDTDITPCPLTDFFGVPLNYPNFTKWKLNVLSFAPLVACRRILLQGKSHIPQQNAPGRMT